VSTETTNFPSAISAKDQVLPHVLVAPPAVTVTSESLLISPVSTLLVLVSPLSQLRSGPKLKVSVPPFLLASIATSIPSILFPAAILIPKVPKECLSCEVLLLDIA
jgi:hypothetical protein